MNASAYNYLRDYIARSDPTCPAQNTITLSSDRVPAPAPDAEALYAGTFAATLPVIERIWAQASPDPTTTTTMLAVLVRFTKHATAHGLTTWDDIPTEVISQFIRHGKDLSDDTHRLRKVTIHGAYLALQDAGLYEGPSPAEGIDPVPNAIRADQRGKRRGAPTPKRKRRAYADRVHVRPASNDEMLVIRLACRLAGTTRTSGLSAAAVAICSSSGTTTEAPQVLWSHLQNNNMNLAGMCAEHGREETAIAARTISLDDWSTQTLEEWRQEKSEVRPVDPTASILYTGNQNLSSLSAQASADGQVRKALQIADLRREAGLSARSLRLWAAARHVTTFADLEVGAGIAGIEPLTLHRQISQQGERGFRSCG